METEGRPPWPGRPVGGPVDGGDGLTAIGVCPFWSAAKSSSIVLIEDFNIGPTAPAGGTAGGVGGGRGGVGEGEAGLPVGKVGLGGITVGGGGKLLAGVDGGVLGAGVGAPTGVGGFIDNPGMLLEELP